MTGKLVRVAALLLCSLAIAPASSRRWKATPDAIAREYAAINDTRPDGELILLIWFVPQMIRPDVPDAATKTSMLRKNVVLVAVHGHLDKTSGTMSFEDINALEAKDQNGRALVSVARRTLLPQQLERSPLSKRYFDSRLAPWEKA